MCDFVMFIWLSSFIIEGIACAVYPVSNPWPTGDHAADNVAKSWIEIYAIIMRYIILVVYKIYFVMHNTNWLLHMLTWRIKAIALGENSKSILQFVLQCTNRILIYQNKYCNSFSQMITNYHCFCICTPQEAQFAKTIHFYKINM